VEIRPASPADAQRIRDIYAHYVESSVATFEETPPETDAIARKVGELQGSGLPFLVAETAGVIQGFAYLGPYRPREAYRYTAEDSVYLAPDARGQGTGKALLNRLLEDGRAAGLREVVAVITVTEEPSSIALHRACGFAEAGVLRRVGFKHGRRLDTLYMQRSLAG
jgi:phosphinothricin acetyltransferase